MADDPPRRYLDSDVIIRFVENHPDDAPVLQQILEQAEGHGWSLVVSALTMVEVTRSPHQPVDLSRFASIQAFFEQPILIIRNVDRDLAVRARDLIFIHPWLYPIDAVHLAAAIDMGCERFCTFDRELIRRMDGQYGLHVMSPGSDATDLPG